MIDKGKVIYGLEIQLDDLQKYADNDQPLTLTQEQAQEIISLLKEQESVIEALKSDLDETLVVLGGNAEIVRCKECKHRGNSEKCVLSAISEEKDFPLFMLDNSGDWFCADGERKDDG